MRCSATYLKASHLIHCKRVWWFWRTKPGFCLFVGTLESCRLIHARECITILVNLRLFSCLKLIYGPQQHGLMFGSSYLNHLDMSFWLGSWYEHPLQSICILQRSPISVWFYPCSYICNRLKMPKKSQINEYSDMYRFYPSIQPEFWFGESVLSHTTWFTFGVCSWSVGVEVWTNGDFTLILRVSNSC